MAVNPITETISTIPTAGHRGVDVQTVFVNKQEAFQDTLTGIFVGEINNLKDQLNIMSSEINDTATQINTDADTASDARDEAVDIKDEVQILYDDFDNRYLGSKESDPTLNNKGQPLQDGAVYYNSLSNVLKIYDLGTTSWSSFPTPYLSALLDVELTSITTGDALKWEGTKWINFNIEDILEGLTPRTTGTTANILPKYSDTNGTLSQSNLYSNAGGDLGLDTTPSLWHASIRAFETKAGALFNYLTTKLSLIQNAYYSVGGIYFYKSTAPATMFEQENGEFKFYTAPSGTSGTSITFTEKVKIDNNGNMIISTQAPQDNSTKVATTAYVDGKFVRGTVVSASGTSIDFTGIPSWVKRITVIFNGVSTNGTSPILVNIGDVEGMETTGYTSTSAYSQSGNLAGALNSTSGFLVNTGTGIANSHNGKMIITNITGNTWVESFVIALNSATAFFGGGNKTTSNILDRIRITTVNGTDTFDAGQINIMYEG